LQTYGADEAPQLPFGYPVMTMMALVPALWRKRMNPRVKAWRQQHYPEIRDWRRYKAASNPMPR
jgi:alkane 1-monooxygenase